jgi:hypothetical protein
MASSDGDDEDSARWATSRDSPGPEQSGVPEPRPSPGTHFQSTCVSLSPSAMHSKIPTGALRHLSVCPALQSDRWGILVKAARSRSNASRLRLSTTPTPRLATDPDKACENASKGTDLRTESRQFRNCLNLLPPRAMPFRYLDFVDSNINLWGASYAVSSRRPSSRSLRLPCALPMLDRRRSR